MFAHRHRVTREVCEKRQSSAAGPGLGIPETGSRGVGSSRVPPTVSSSACFAAAHQTRPAISQRRRPGGRRIRCPFTLPRPAWHLLRRPLRAAYRSRPTFSRQARSITGASRGPPPLRRRASIPPFVQPSRAVVRHQHAIGAARVVGASAACTGRRVTPAFSAARFAAPHQSAPPAALACGSPSLACRWRRDSVSTTPSPWHACASRSCP
jgi:hypothetical protein